MSRVAEKKAIKKSKRRLLLGLVSTLMILALGLFVVDNVIRDMLGLYDGPRVLGYSREGQFHYIEWIGKQYYIDQQQVVDTVENYIGKWKDTISVLLDKIKNTTKGI